MNDVNMIDAKNVIVKLNKAKARLKELVEIISKAEKEKGHIEYMFSQFAKSDEDKEPERFMDRKKVYTEVFEENRHRGLHSSEILKLLKERGYNVKKTTHHANLSQFIDDPKMPIERIKVGYYRYNPNKLPY